MNQYFSGATHLQVLEAYNHKVRTVDLRGMIRLCLSGYRALACQLSEPRRYKVTIWRRISPE